MSPSSLSSFWASGIRMTTIATTSSLPINSIPLPKWLLPTICFVGGLNTVSRNSKIPFTLTTTRSGISIRLTDTGIFALPPGLLLTGSSKMPILPKSLIRSLLPSTKSNRRSIPYSNSPLPAPYQRTRNLPTAILKLNLNDL